jgi:hypothetical protein
MLEMKAPRGALVQYPIRRAFINITPHVEEYLRESGVTEQETMGIRHDLPCSNN